jgi:hypothetical protein
MSEFARLYLLLGLAGGLLALLMDAEAFFSLTSYLPVYVLSLAYVAIGISRLVRHSRIGRLSPMGRILILGAFLVAGIALILPYIRTSPRKNFHLDAAALEPGMDVEVIRQRMRRYKVFDNAAEGYIAFVFRASAHTEDRVIVDLTQDGKVRSIEVVTN